MPGLRSFFVVCSIVVLASPAIAAADEASPLSPRLVVLSSPKVRGLGADRQARRVGLTPSGAGSLLRHGRRVLVDVRFGNSAATRAEALGATGAEVIEVSPEYQTVTVAALPGQLRRVAAVPGVEGVQEEITPFTSAASCPQGVVVSEGDRQLEAARARNSFGVDGSGVTVGILSDSFNQWTGAPASEASDVATGDLPGPGNPCGFQRPVKVVQPLIPGAYPEEGEEPENPPEEGEEGADEGRAMAQIVHDLAPGADIDFASAFNGELSFAQNIRGLYDEGARVIADDVAYFNEPFFQDGPIADAVNEVVAGGANYFSSAGNDNLVNAAGEDIGSIEAPEFRETTCPAAIPAEYTACMNFDPEPGGAEDNAWEVTVEEGSPLYVDLQWAQPWNGVTTDLDMFVLNENDELVGRAFNTPNTEPGRQQPYEFDPWEGELQAGRESENLKVVVARCDEACGAIRAEEEIEPGVKPYAGTVGGDDGTPRLKVAIFNNGGGVSETEYTPAEVEETGDVVGPTIFGHTAAASAISVAAINVGTDEEPEGYSSRGPVVHLFGPVDGTEAAPSIGEEAIAKPNVTASDCGSTTFFYGFSEGGFHFCGTSAAAPHAAAVAALIRSADPGVTNAEVRADMEATARPVGTSLAVFGPDAVGAGLVDANAAVAALAPTPAPAPAPTVTITGPPAAKPGTESEPSEPPPASPPSPLAPGEPVVTFTVHPKPLVKVRKKFAKVEFGLASNIADSTFRCQIDTRNIEPCPASFVGTFRLGRHAVSVEAVGPSGVVGQPVTFKFQVRRLIPRHKGGGGHL